MKKKCKIIMLPNDTGRVCRNNIKQKLFGNSIGLKAELRMGDCTNQHLYIISDDTIKQGEMCYCISNDCLVRYSDFGDQQSNYKKIIASTDKLIVGWDYKNDVPNGNDYNKFIPGIPEEFIKLYIERHNSGNPIEEVEVEYEISIEKGGIERLSKIEPYKSFPEELPYCVFIETFKLDSNNCISIQSTKDSYTREEVIQLLKKYDGEFVTTKKLSSLCFDKWIEENL